MLVAGAAAGRKRSGECGNRICGLKLVWKLIIINLNCHRKKISEMVVKMFYGLSNRNSCVCLLKLCLSLFFAISACINYGSQLCDFSSGTNVNII